jgi:hypothetical protein
MEDDMATEQQNANLAKARAARAANRADAAVNRADAAVSEMAAQKTEEIIGVGAAGARTPLRDGEVVGRNGEVLSRKRTVSGDIFDVPNELIPKGWEYQWCAVTVVGNTEILMDQNLMLAENGWRPVPSSRHAGRFMPPNHQGSIIRGGQMLMERPKSLCDEARAEDVRLARQLISDRNESLKLSGVRKNMGDGFEMGPKYRGTGGDIRMSIDRALDAPKPSHPLAEPGE